MEMAEEDGVSSVGLLCHLANYMRVQISSYLQLSVHAIASMSSRSRFDSRIGVIESRSACSN
jgi:hypothetical protein